MKTLRLVSIGFFAVLLSLTFVSYDSTYSTSKKGNRTFNVGGVEFTMIYVEGGTFMMGCDDADWFYSEKPVHQVTLSDYYIGQTEVTQKLWQAVMGNNPSAVKGGNLPVEQVSWDDCQEFIRKLNKITGENFCLPTEAQWEFAARGGKKSKGYKYSGSNDINSVAWYNENSDDKTHPVATKQANILGIYDMSGNVLEWCQDWYGKYTSAAVTDPIGASSGSKRVHRGGGWCFAPSSCHYAYRFNDMPTVTADILGLRLACSSYDYFFKPGPDSIPIPIHEPLDPTPVNNPRNPDLTIVNNPGNPDSTPAKNSGTPDPISGSENRTFNVGNVEFTMVYVEGGTFMMGSNYEINEKPIHQVTLSSGYYIGETEVTQALWQAVMGSNPSKFKGDNLPVEQVSWNDCQKFIGKLNQITGEKFCLPTEAQWEFAARGGNKSKGYKYSGSNDIDAVAWYCVNSDKKTHPVGTKLANELGIYDMSGNVWECCSDWTFGYSPEAVTDPTGNLSSGTTRICRGGGFAWYDYPADSRCTARDAYIPEVRNSNRGLRLVMK